jgi:hypothetical protein
LGLRRFVFRFGAGVIGVGRRVTVGRKAAWGAKTPWKLFEVGVGRRDEGHQATHEGGGGEDEDAARPA